MAAMSTAMATVAAVPAAAGLRIESSSLESTARSSPSSVLMGQRKAAAHVPARRGAVVVRASGSEQGSEVWNVAKGAAAAAAIALVLGASSPAQAAFPKFPDNAAGEASRKILGDAKAKGDASFAEAQKTGNETTGQAASAGDAAPAISQVDPNAEEASDPVGNSIAAKADSAADLAPGTSQQAKKGVNAIEKAFATPTRGLGDKQGETEARASDLVANKGKSLPGDDVTIKQQTGVSEGIFNSFKAAGEGRDAGVGVKPQ